MCHYTLYIIFFLQAVSARASQGGGHVQHPHSGGYHRVPEPSQRCCARQSRHHVRARYTSLLYWCCSHFYIVLFWYCIYYIGAALYIGHSMSTTVDFSSLFCVVFFLFYYNYFANKNVIWLKYWQQGDSVCLLRIFAMNTDHVDNHPFFIFIV